MAESKSSKEKLAELLPNVEDRERWLQVLYAEMWKQCSHESQLAQTRSTVFLAIQTTTLAVLATVSGYLFKIPCLTVWERRTYLGMLLVGIFWIILGSLLCAMNIHFRRVTRAGQLYVNFRHALLRALELATVGADVGPALLEHSWRNPEPDRSQTSGQSQASPMTVSTLPNESILPAPKTIAPSEGSGDKVYLFKHMGEILGIKDISQISVHQFVKDRGGFPYLYATAKTWFLIYISVIVAGIGLMVGSQFADQLSLLGWNVCQ